MSEKLIRLQDVLERTGCKRSKVYDLVARGLFPRPVKIGSAARWPESKVRDWIAARIAETERGEA